MFRCLNLTLDPLPVKDYLDNVVKYLEADMAFQAGEFSRWSERQKSEYITSVIINSAPSSLTFADINACLEYAEENEQVLDIAYYKKWLMKGVSYLNIDGNNRTINLVAFYEDEFPLLPGEYRVDEWFGEVVKGKNDLYSTMPTALRKKFDESMMFQEKNFLICLFALTMVSL